MKQTTFTHQQFIEWIMSQPPDRRLNMDESRDFDRSGNDTCGCLLVQFGRSLGLRHFTAGSFTLFAHKEECSSSEVYSTNKLINELLVNPLSYPTFYEVQQHILKQQH